MDRNSLDWLLDLLVGILFFIATFVVVGYGMDLANGAERNAVMDRGIIAAALMAVFLLSIQLMRRKK